MRLADWRAGDVESSRPPTLPANDDALPGAASRLVSRWRLTVLLLLLVAVAVLQPRLSRMAARFAPPIAATGEFLMETGGRWQGHSVFTMDRSSAVLAAIADGTWPTPERAWPSVRAVRMAPDLYALGPDHTGALVYYAVPGEAGHHAWIASPGRDGKWTFGKEEPLEVAKLLDEFAARFETDTLRRIADGRSPGPWLYNVRWGDDHIVFLDVMLLARGRHDVIRERLEHDPRAVRDVRRLDLPTVWRDQADAAAALLAAIQTEAAPAPIPVPSA